MRYGGKSSRIAGLAVSRPYSDGMKSLILLPGDEAASVREAERWRSEPVKMQMRISWSLSRLASSEGENEVLV